MQNLHNHWTERFHHVIKITGSCQIGVQHVTVICMVIGCSNCSDHDKEFSHCRIPEGINRDTLDMQVQDLFELLLWR